jgi:glycosyltransferase involved in cell wall biosynthesis
MKKVLVIRYEGIPFAIRMSKEIQTILDLGFECDIFIPDDGIGNINVSKDVGRDLSTKVSIKTFKSMTSLKGINRISKIWRDEIYDLEFIIALKKLMRESKYSSIWVKDSKSLRQIYSVLDELGVSIPVHCTMYENAYWQAVDGYNFGSLKQKILYKFRNWLNKIKQVENEFLPRCESIITVVEEAKESLLQRYSITPEKIHVVHNVEILSDFDSFKVEKTLSLKCHVTYVGSLGKHRGVELFLEALTKMKNDSVKVTIVGASSERKIELQNKLNELMISVEVEIIEFVSHKTAMEWIWKSDVGVVPHVNSEFIRTTIPNKLFQYMSASAAVVVSNVGPLERIVKKEDCGVVFQEGSADDFAKKLDELVDDRKKLESYGFKGRRAVEMKYNWKHQKSIYSKILNNPDFHLKYNTSV